MSSEKRFSWIGIGVVCTLISFTAVLGWLSYVLKTSVGDLLNTIFLGSYLPHVNIFVPIGLNGQNIFFYYYLTALITVVLLVLANFILKKKFSDVVVLALGCTFALVCLVESVGLGKEFVKETKYFAGKTLEEKHRMILGPEATQFQKQLHEGYFRAFPAEFRTDMDLTRDPGMITHRKLAYYLFPIDIRGVHGDDYAALITYYKGNIPKDILEEYDIASKYQNFAIWLKKEQ